MIYEPMRYVDAIQIEHEGQPMVLLNDPEGLSESLAVSIPFFLVLSMMDGRSDGPAIQQQLMQVTDGQLVPIEQIEMVARQADELYLVENQRAADRRAELEREFKAMPSRPATHAGHSYPDDPEQCRAFFEEMFQGLPANETPEEAAVDEADGANPRGLIVPHIDFRVGGRTIARGLTALHRERPPRLYIVLGVAHHPTRNLFTVTDKPFDTPLGQVATDRGAVERLRELYGADALDGAIAHKTEHSVEFPAVALKHLHGSTPFSMLPILCGSLHEEIADGDGTSPAARPEVARFIEALRTIAGEYGGDVCVVASVDLSHVGLKFGDMEGVDDERAADVRRADERMLRMVEVMDPEGFFNHFRADGNVRNVDAVTAVYVMLHVLREGQCRTIDYDQWREQETDSMVTYASLAVY